MALSPLDIHNKEFSSRMRGYDKDEVNDFLAQIIKDYSTVIKENETLQKELADAKDKNQYFTDMKEALNQSIIVAQESADRVKNTAQQEADLIKQQAQQDGQDILTKAHADADQLVRDAKDQQQQISLQTEDLRRQSRVFRQRLQVMLESQLEVVNSPEWKEILSSSPEAPDTTDPSLDNTPVQSVNSKTASAQSYTEIIFPEDQVAEAQAPTFESEAASEAMMPAQTGSTSTEDNAAQ